MVLTVHVLKADAHGIPVGLKLLHLGKLHNRLTHVSQALGREVRAGDVLNEGSQVDTRVLLSITVRSCDLSVSASFSLDTKISGDDG